MFGGLPDHQGAHAGIGGHRVECVHRMVSGNPLPPTLHGLACQQDHHIIVRQPQCATLFEALRRIQWAEHIQVDAVVDARHRPAGEHGA